MRKSYAYVRCRRPAVESVGDRWTSKRRIRCKCRQCQ